MDNRTIDDHAFGKLVDEVRDWIAWRLPITLTEDELTSIDDSVLIMLRDLFVIEEAK